jgi:hypothetical protein
MTVPFRSKFFTVHIRHPTAGRYLVSTLKCIVKQPRRKKITVPSRRPLFQNRYVIHHVANSHGYSGVVWTGLFWLWIRSSGGACENGSINFWDILEQLSDWRLLKEDSARWSYRRFSYRIFKFVCHIWQIVQPNVASINLLCYQYSYCSPYQHSKQWTVFLMTWHDVKCPVYTWMGAKF